MFKASRERLVLFSAAAEPAPVQLPAIPEQDLDGLPTMEILPLTRQNGYYKAETSREPIVMFNQAMNIANNNAIPLAPAADNLMVDVINTSKVATGLNRQ